MALGKLKEKKVTVRLNDKQVQAKKEFIKAKINKLKNSIKIPPAINQFKTFLEPADEQRVFKLYNKYKPENKKEKKERLTKEKTSGKGTEKVIIAKFGMKHIVDLIIAKKLKHVLIAADVVPITIVAFLPALCKQFEVNYGIVEKQTKLGALVNNKRASVVGLCDVKSEDASEFKSVIEMCNGSFMNKYEEHSTKVGGLNTKSANKLEE